MNRATSATGWVRNPVLKLPDLDPTQASSYELGWTWNPITGCLNHTPEGLCLGGMFPCYAYKLAHGRLRDRYLANDNIPNPAMAIQYLDDLPPAHKSDPFYPRFWPERLEEFSELAYKPRGIFTCDMSDLFGIGVPEEWTRQVLSTIKYQFFHRFYLLTKQPLNLIKFSPFPDNCWVGVTATDAVTAYEAVNYLRDIEAKVKYISCEPLLDTFRDEPKMMPRHLAHFVDWVIIGAQTKPDKPPKIEWVEEIVRACDKAGVPVFIKDNLKPVMRNSAWRIRQDMPE